MLRPRDPMVPRSLLTCHPVRPAGSPEPCPCPSSGGGPSVDWALVPGSSPISTVTGRSQAPASRGPAQRWVPGVGGRLRSSLPPRLAEVRGSGPARPAACLGGPRAPPPGGLLGLHRLGFRLFSRRPAPPSRPAFPSAYPLSASFTLEGHVPAMPTRSRASPPPARLHPLVTC